MSPHRSLVPGRPCPDRKLCFKPSFPALPPQSGHALPLLTSLFLMLVLGHAQLCQGCSRLCTNRSCGVGAPHGVPGIEPGWAVCEASASPLSGRSGHPSDILEGSGMCAFHRCAGPSTSAHRGETLLLKVVCLHEASVVTEGTHPASKSRRSHLRGHLSSKVNIFLGWG